MLDCIVGSGRRANDVIGQIRSLLKKTPLQKEGFDIKDGIHEVLALSRGEITKNAISVRTQLAAGLPPIEGDRVQLQQVVPIRESLESAAERWAHAQRRPCKSADREAHHRTRV